MCRIYKKFAYTLQFCQVAYMFRACESNEMYIELGFRGRYEPAFVYTESGDLSIRTAVARFFFFTEGVCNER